MKSYIYKLFAKLPVLGIMVLLAVSCIPEQEVSPIDSPDDNALLTFTPGGTYTNVAEGDTLKFTISLDKYVQREVAVGPVFADAANVRGIDYEVVGGIIAPYTFDSEIWLIVTDDGMPENDENFSFEISAEDDIAWSWQLHPSSTISVSSTIADGELDNTVVTIGVGWADAEHDDWDLYVVDADGGYDYSSASGSDPEVNISLDDSSPDGTYSIAVDPFHVENQITDFEVGIALPDGSKHVKTITFDSSLLSSYTVLEDVESGAILLATVTKSGTSYTVTFQ